MSGVPPQLFRSALRIHTAYRVGSSTTVKFLRIKAGFMRGSCDLVVIQFFADVSANPPAAGGTAAFQSALG